ncbi:hypothetical protein L1987_39446 [Smallanthus sonchifolius]|uniref:Uncharacterized protein n=2 Tax=Smallanthus sonchifolius TaxID=185202 RepID=A0ACB9HN85_9ASTR|nr:hypothetical protein L1987_39440 [Smallanthus sonchifolius]KAI3796761.1 hypothetical protein L1987_39446 [Smallanthus sonchifolius]
MLKLTQPPPAVLALRNIAEELGKTDWNFNLNPCATTNNSNWATPKQPERPSYNNTVECNCSYTGGVCHVIKIFLKGQDLDGVLPPSLAKLPYIKTIDLTRNYLNGTIPPEWASTNLEYLSLESNMFSGTVPAELGKLENLVNLILNANNLSGELPMELNNLVNLTELRLSSNNFTGRIPNFESLKQLTKLEIHGSGMEGPIPESISLLSNLNELISDLSGESSLFPNLSSMINMTRLYVTGNSLNGSVPSWLTDGSGTVVVDLSYNHFSNETVLPTCGQSLNLFRSYTGWKDSDLAKCLNNFTCLKDYNSAHINCGGIETTIASKSYEADQDPAGPAKFLLSSNQWGFSSTGNVLDLDNYIYTVNNVSRLTMKDSELYTAARLSPLSITYYGRCLANGMYRVRLHFAEIVFRDNNSYQSLGRRAFDVYIQGAIKLKNFDIKNEAGGVDKAVIKEIKNIHVTNGTLEIRFQYAGKGTTVAPTKGVFGPLISAISVESESKPGKTSTFIIIGAVAAALCLALIVVGIAWQRCYRGGKMSREKDLKGLDLKSGVFTYRQIKAATDNFSDSNKLGEGGFGPVYKGHIKIKEPDINLITSDDEFRLQALKLKLEKIQSHDSDELVTSITPPSSISHDLYPNSQISEE